MLSWLECRANNAEVMSLVRETAGSSCKIEYPTIGTLILINYDTASPNIQVCRLANNAITPKDAPEVGVIALKVQNRIGVNMGIIKIEKQTIYFGAKGRADAVVREQTKLIGAKYRADAGGNAALRRAHSKLIDIKY
ncbi:hypothetical protein OUZ56_023928 [Daphnia magna]|uniref:Profilin n=1 Tax=Daphnia magna TaxID=35525 RepID=A0ABR0AZU3_9CRUS|nr:hypothetical protein OUZ56_023928 [Daphnia magna]